MINIHRLIGHPEYMDKETLYDLRSILALYPYYQPARLLMLQNLYILHDPLFDEELKKTAVYLTHRKTLFQLVEAKHYKIEKKEQRGSQPVATSENKEDRTISLIDNFLEAIPDNETKTTRKPTPADAAIDYVSYLLEIEENGKVEEEQTPQLRGQELIDQFIYKEGGKMQLKETPEYLPQVDAKTDGDDEGKDDVYTETLAKIYIRQQRYDKALEIIQRLYLNYPKKNTYFADQIRFLEKLIINNQQNK